MTLGEPTGADDALRTSRTQAAQAALVILEAYRAMPKEWLRQRLLVEYRCPNRRNRCLLLHGWAGDGGDYFYFIPPYRLSATRNAERTVATARAKNTLDGGRWKPRAGSLGELQEFGSTVGLDLQCDHLDPIVISAEEVLEDARHAVPGRPLKRVIRRRLPVE